MTTMLKGTEVAAELRTQVGHKVLKWKACGITPRVAALLVEGDPASAYYAASKAKLAEKLGIAFTLIPLPQDTSEERLVDVVHGLNANPSVHGIMLELPLPKHISVPRVTETIASVKDVDGLSPANRLAVVTGRSGLYPATPAACIRLVKHYGYTLQGKNVVVVGRGQTVGMPLMHLLLRENATVTVCHSKTESLSEHLKRADIAFVAAGRANLIQPDMVSPNLVLVDAGINELPTGGITGDVAPNVCDHVAALSPTPGGVGPVTTAQLFDNLMAALSFQHPETV